MFKNRGGKMEKFYLEIPSLGRKEDAIDYIQEFHQYHSAINGVGGLDRYIEDYADWLEKLKKDATRIPNEKKVPAKTYFLVRQNDCKIVGMINIRLTLNEHLKKFGGHIGYSIRPTERGKGYNKINLYLGLKICQSHGISKVLMDADTNNPASWKTMEALGGVFVREYYDDEEAHCYVKDYEINVDQSLHDYAPIYEKMIYYEDEEVFSSSHISFVKLQHSLVDEYVRMVNDPDVNKFISKHSITYSMEAEKEWIQKKLDSKATIYSMLEKNSHRFIGNIELMRVENQEGELGICITPLMQNKHYGREALTAFVNYCFETFHLNRIYLKAYSHNKRAIHVYQLVGFQMYQESSDEVCMEIRKNNAK